MKKADSWQQENGRENTLFLKALYHREKCKSKNLLNLLFFFQNIFPKFYRRFIINAEMELFHSLYENNHASVHVAIRFTKTKNRIESRLQKSADTDIYSTPYGDLYGENAKTSEEHCCVVPYTACSVFLQAICICNRNDNKDRNGLCSCRK